MKEADNSVKSQRPSRVKQQVDQFRDRLSYHDALPQMVALGVLSGLAAALLIVAFRWLIDTPLALTLGDNVDDFESLPPLWRFLLPFTGALLLGVLLSFLKENQRSVSVSHVLERLHNYQGKLPLANIALQFVGGVIALVSGQSVGREGPSIHLGAGVASQLGQRLKLPNNALRTLVACGAAAGIAASFNTPLAGVVFAMEVILMEYTIIGFIPVILASVLGATINQLVFGTELSFVAIESRGELVTELPFMVLSGAVFALFAATFIRIHLWCLWQGERPVWQRFLIIGLLTGSVAIYLPQILGTGYDTLNLAIGNNIDLQLLLVVVLAKLVVTAVATGLGMVGGIIGPTLMMGGCLGAVMGWLGNSLAPSASEQGFYVVLGMVAMMGAVLNAPLAALVAILELSHNPGILFPAMLLVVVACLGVQGVFSYQGIFAEQLRVRGHDLFAEPGRGFLSRVGVRSVMNRSFRVAVLPLSREEVARYVESEAIWLVVELDGPDQSQSSAEREQDVYTQGDSSGDGLTNNYRLIAMADLARFLEDQKASEGKTRIRPEPGELPATAAEGGREIETEVTPQTEALSLNELLVQQYDIALVDSLASLHEANQVMRQSGAQVLLVIDSHSYTESRVVGVISRASLTNYYGM